MLRQSPDADLPGCHADDEGENDRSLITSDTKTRPLKPGTDRQTEYQLIHLIPFNSNSPTGSTFTAFSTFINTRGLMRICPGLASSQRREATLDTVPIAAFSRTCPRSRWCRVWRTRAQCRYARGTVSGGREAGLIEKAAGLWGKAGQRQRVGRDQNDHLRDGRVPIDRSDTLSAATFVIFSECLCESRPI